MHFPLAVPSGYAQRAQLEKLTADSVQSQDCLRESFSFLKVPV